VSHRKETDIVKTNRIVTLALAAALVVTGSALAASVKSGPQVGDDLAGPFHPLNINGPQAGKKFCLYCTNGSNPVAMVFARECSPTLEKLIKKIDACTAENKDCKMGSFVVFCSNEEGLETKLKKVAKDNNIKNCVLSIDNPAGPKGYNVAKDADVTVVLYVDRNVKANHSFKKDELKEKNIETIVADIKKILPSK
jgi:hypothetical protein